MNDKDYAFLGSVKNYVKENPHILPRLVEVATAGVLEGNDELRRLKTEMETIAIAATSARFKNRFEFVKQKIKNIPKEKLSFIWTDILGD